MLIKIENGKPTGYPIASENFRQLFPGTSFPAYLTPESVDPFGYGLYDFTEKPEVSRYQRATEGESLQDESGIWRQQWILEEMNEEEKQQADAAQESLIRGERIGKLFMSDWTQLPDSPADHEVWATYRQELRDVTAQEGFPWDVTWPEAP